MLDTYVEKYAPLLGVREENIPKHLYYGDISLAKAHFDCWAGGMVSFSVGPAFFWDEKQCVTEIADTRFYVWNQYPRHLMQITILHELQHIRQVQDWVDDGESVWGYANDYSEKQYSAEYPYDNPYELDAIEKSLHYGKLIHGYDLTPETWWESIADAQQKAGVPYPVKPIRDPNKSYG